MLAFPPHTQEAREFQLEFKKMDTDKSGTLSGRELHAYYKRLIAPAPLAGSAEGQTERV